MMDELVNLIEKVIMKEGMEGKLRLADAIARDKRSIERYRSREVRPRSHVAYKLALACGCSQKKAEELALSYSASRARETA